MKPVPEAIKYGLDILNISSDKFKSIIEESNGYAGEDKERWLASKIIEVAEKNGVLFTQLLAKWDLYLVEIEEEIETGVGMVISEELEYALRGLVKHNSLIVSLGKFDRFIDQLDETSVVATNEDGSENFNWRKGIDLLGSPDFASSVDERFVSALEDEEESVTIFASLNGTRALDKNSELISDAKQSGYKLQNEGQGVLYRLMTLHRAFPNADITVAMYSSQKFWSDNINRSLIREFLSVFRVKLDRSFFAPAKDFDANNHRDGYGVMINATNSYTQPEVQTLELSRFGNENQKRVFLNHNETDFDHFYASNKGVLRVPSITNGVVEGYRNAGSENAIGYYCKNGNITIENLPREGANSAGFGVEDLPHVVASFGLTKAFNVQGEYMNGIPRILTGQEGIENLISNCIPLFLYGTGSNLRDWGSITGEDGTPVRISNLLNFDGDAIKGLMDRLYPFMDFEARDFLDDMKEIEEDEGMTISEYREKCMSGEIEDEDFLKSYKDQHNRLREHIIKNYSHFI